MIRSVWFKLKLIDLVSGGVLFMVKKLGQVLLSSVMLFSVTVEANSRDVDLVRETQQFSQGKNVAVIVGVENYDRGSSGFRPLKYSMDDAVKLTSTLQKKGYYVRRLLNQQAQKSFILNEIRNIAKTVPQGNGTLIFSFSGHGALINQENYLAVPGSVSDNLVGTGLSVSDVVRTIKQSGIKRAVLFLDACRNDPTPGIRAAGESGFFDRDYGEGIQVLYATKKGEYSWEHDRLQQGVFNHFLNRGFAGEAAYQGGVVTFSSLASFVERNVPLWTNDRQNQIFQTQLPFRDAKSEYRGDFVLVGGSGNIQPVLRQPVPTQPLRQPSVQLDNLDLFFDSDKDGVMDSRDQCPETNAGNKVDYNGCSLDSDEDGIMDSRDQCPNTANGSRVDYNGCSFDDQIF